MTTKKDPSTYIMVLAKGEKIVQSLISFCQDQGIAGAWVSGLGALSNVDLAFYHLDTKEFSKKIIDKPLELLSLNGNIAQKDSETVSHLHVVVSDDKMQTLGGHLNEATVAATCEIKLEAFDFAINRKFSSEIGLNLIDSVG